MDSGAAWPTLLAGCQKTPAASGSAKVTTVLDSGAGPTAAGLQDNDGQAQRGKICPVQTGGQARENL